MIVIPDRLSRVVTRQLLYTGVTRAREKAIILGRMEIIKEAMDLSVEKTSNVSSMLARELGSNAPDPVMEP